MDMEGEILTLTDETGHTLNCYLEASVELDSEKFALLSPVDYPVDIFAWVDNGEDEEILMPIEDAELSEIFATAQAVLEEDIRVNRAMGKYGATIIHDGDAILTHCNAGALATVDYGTALGVIRAAREKGKRISVIATETRPKLQGAKLTAHELKQEKIPFVLI